MHHLTNAVRIQLISRSPSSEKTYTQYLRFCSSTMDSVEYCLGRYWPTSVVLFRRSGMWLRHLKRIYRPCSRFFFLPVPITWHTPHEFEHLQVYELLRLRRERPQQQLTKHTWRLERPDLAVHRHKRFHRHHSLLYRRVY